jgi:microcystin-dependent protein
MSEPFLGEIRMFAGNFPPRGWAKCDGQLMAISQNDALFALLGTTYGGDGVTTFGLPDLRSRIPLHQGQGTGLSSYALGQAAGTETITLTSNQIPQHSHLMSAPNASTNSPSLAAFGSNGLAIYKVPPASATMAANIIQNAGGNQPHENLMPFLVVTFIIALEGIFPSQN